MTVIREKRHDCLGMILDFNKKHHIDVDTTHCQEAMGEDFLEEIKPNGKAPQNDALFKTHDHSPLLSE